MTYTLFFILDYQFQKVFYVSLGNIFYCFCGGPLVVEAPGQLTSLPPALKSGPALTQPNLVCYRRRLTCRSVFWHTCTS